MAAIGSAVGLGNLWRFPYVCYRNGGGAFLIPYLVALLTAGIPLMILEYGLGIRKQGSAPKALASVNRKWEFVGWWALCIGFMISMYYVVIMGVTGVYLVESFNTSLPWGTTAASAGDHFYHDVLQISSGPFDFGGMAWGVLIAALAVWGIIFLIIFKGVKQVGKVVMITVPLPWLMIVVLMIRGLTLEGAAEGINYYLAPNWAALLQPSTWLAAYGQIFFSLSLGFGIMIAYASYMARTSDVSNNAFITSFANCATSFLAGFSVFSVLGYFAVAANLPVSDVLKSGPGLAFQAYPAALAKLGEMASWMAPLFSVVFFVALLTLGIDSAFSIVEAFASGIEDKFKWSKIKTAAVLCVVGAVGSAWFATKAGLYWLDITDMWISESYGLVVIGLLECIMLGWFTKLSSFRDEINSVSEVRVGRWWDICIKILTPVALVLILVLMTIDKVRPARVDFSVSCGKCGHTVPLGSWSKDAHESLKDAQAKASESGPKFCPKCAEKGLRCPMSFHCEYTNKYAVDYPSGALILGGWLWVLAAPIVGLVLMRMRPKNRNWLEVEG